MSSSINPNHDPFSGSEPGQQGQYGYDGYGQQGYDQGYGQQGYDGYGQQGYDQGYGHGYDQQGYDGYSQQGYDQQMSAAAPYGQNAPQGGNGGGGTGKIIAIVGGLIVVLALIGGLIYFLTKGGDEGDGDNGGGGGDETTAAGSSAPTSSQGGKDSGKGGGKKGGEGSSRENALPVGSTIENDDWKVTLDSVNLNANDDIKKANDFNKDPDAGKKYMMADITAEYIGDDPQGKAPMITVEYVSPSGESVNQFESIVVIDDDFELSKTLYSGASTSGKMVFPIPESDGDEGTLSIQLDFKDEKKFFKLK